MAAIGSTTNPTASTVPPTNGFSAQAPLPTFSPAEINSIDDGDEAEFSTTQAPQFPSYGAEAAKPPAEKKEGGSAGKIFGVVQAILPVIASFFPPAAAAVPIVNAVGNAVQKQDKA